MHPLARGMSLRLLRLLLTVSATTLILTAHAIPARVLIYSATERYRHDSIPTAIAALQGRGPSANLQFDATEDETKFNDGNLGVYDAVMFLSTTGEVLDDAGKTAFLNYLKKGGNFVGVHSASDTLVNTTFYGLELGVCCRDIFPLILSRYRLPCDVESRIWSLWRSWLSVCVRREGTNLNGVLTYSTGAYFDYHPALQNATVDVIGPSHPSTDHLPKVWNVQDEIYNFKSDPRSIGATVILAANDASYIDNGTRTYDQGSPHPLAWYQTTGAGVSGEEGAMSGRSFYTSLGHLNETWQDDNFLSHVFGGLAWVLRSNTTRAMNPLAGVGNPEGSVSGSGSGTSSGTSTAAGTSSSPSPSSSSAISDRLGGIPSLEMIVITVFSLMLGYLGLGWASDHRDNAR